MANEKENKLSFKEFAKKQIDEVVLPANVVATPEDEELIPALFATIHHKSDTRPDGYTPEDIEDMNNAANAHMPHLQTDRAKKDGDQD